MPLLSPQIQKALRASGLLENTEEKTSLSEKLEKSNLSLDDLLSSLYDFSQNASAENLRLDAIKTALKMHGALSEQTPAPPSVTFIIQGEEAQEVNPILIPRSKIVSIQ